MNNPIDERTCDAFMKVKKEPMGERVFKFIEKQYDKTLERLVFCSKEEFPIVQGEARVLRHLIELSEIEKNMPSPFGRD